MFARPCPDPLGHIIFVGGMVWYVSDSPWSLVNDKAFDRLYHQVITTLDPKEQNKLSQELQKMIIDEAFSLFTYQEIKLYAMSRRVEYIPYISGMLYFEGARILRKTTEGSP
jgi:ABC-type transport system substrate-binding protein